MDILLRRIGQDCMPAHSPPPKAFYCENFQTFRTMEGMLQGVLAHLPPTCCSEHLICCQSGGKSLKSQLLRRLWQEDYKFKASVGNLVRSCIMTKNEKGSEYSSVAEYSGLYLPSPSLAKQRKCNFIYFISIVCISFWSLNYFNS